jgi:hypothetical protein
MRQWDYSLVLYNFLTASSQLAPAVMSFNYWDEKKKGDWT